MFVHHMAGWLIPGSDIKAKLPENIILISKKSYQFFPKIFTGDKRRNLF